MRKGLLSILGKNSSLGLEELCDRRVRGFCIFVFHTNHIVGCIHERIKLPIRKQDGIYINLETCQFTVHFMAYYLVIFPLPM